MSFGATLKYLRKSQDVTQEELAKCLGVTRSTIAGYETRNKQPDYEKLIKIGKRFNVSIDYLLTGNNTSITVTPPRTYSEKALDHFISINLKKLSLTSKQSLFDYIQLLNLRDHSAPQKKS